MKIDKSNMRQKILDFPKQFRVGLNAAAKVKIKNSRLRPSFVPLSGASAGKQGFGGQANLKSVIVCGMGGSALQGDIANMYLEDKKSDISLHIHSDYGLPYFTDKNHLIICASYSGNTEETISAFEEARKRNLKIAAVASGGKLVELCKLYKIPIAIIPAGYQPRMALGFQFAALVKILENCGFLLKNKTDSGLISLESALKPAELENQGKKLSKNLKNKIPIIYASRKFKYLARIWKIKFNENSKIPAFYNYFPELNHNELVGFENNACPISIIILRDNSDNPRTKKRMELTADILKKRGINVDIIEIVGKNTINKFFSNILVADWASYYLALEYGVDPTPVKLNDEFKKRLAR